MKRQKRDKGDRAYNKGYHAGLASRPKDSCPHSKAEVRQRWMNGWSEGRNDSWSALNGVSGLCTITKHEFA